MHPTISIKFEVLDDAEDLINFFYGEYLFWKNLLKPAKRHHESKLFDEFIDDFNKLVGANNTIFRVEKPFYELKTKGRLKKELIDFYNRWSIPTRLHYEKLKHKGILVDDVDGEFYLAALLDNKRNQVPDNAMDSIKNAVDIANKEFQETRSLSYLYNIEDLVTKKINSSHQNLDEIQKKFEIRNNELALELDNFKKKLTLGFSEDMEAFKRAYQGEIKVRASVSYWEDKSRAHKFKAWMTIGFLSLFLVLVYCFLQDPLVHLVGELSKIQIDEKKSFLDNNFRYIIVGLIFTLFVWVVRIFIKLWLSHIHLHNDAAERVVMIKTYISFLAENNINDIADKSFIINAIFRPSNDGMVKDDGMPNPIIELITKTR